MSRHVAVRTGDAPVWSTDTRNRNGSAMATVVMLRRRHGFLGLGTTDGRQRSQNAARHAATRTTGLSDEGRRGLAMIETIVQ